MDIACPVNDRPYCPSWIFCGDPNRIVAFLPVILVVWYWACVETYPSIIAFLRRSTLDVLHKRLYHVRYKKVAAASCNICSQKAPTILSVFAVSVPLSYTYENQCFVQLCLYTECGVPNTRLSNSYLFVVMLTLCWPWRVEVVHFFLCMPIHRGAIRSCLKGTGDKKLLLSEVTWIIVLFWGIGLLEWLGWDCCH